MELAVNGAQYVRALGRAHRIDSRKAFDMVAVLEATGVVRKRVRDGGRKFVSLDRSFPGYRALRTLLLSMAKEYGLDSKPRPARWGMPAERDTWAGGDIDLLFGSPNRTRLLLFLAMVGCASLRTASALLGIGYLSSMYAARSLVRDGLLTSHASGRYRFYEIDRRYHHYEELLALLTAIFEIQPEYAALARLSSTSER